MRIRAATAADYPAFVRLFPLLETGDDVASQATWVEDLMPSTLLFEQDGEVAGYIYFQVLDGLGYVRHVVVSPAHRRRGIGRALMGEVADRLTQAGIGTWYLNVKPDNVAAIVLYEQMGMTLQFASCAMRMGWDIIERLPFADGIVVGDLAADQDHDVESTLGLPTGLLAQQRSSSGAHLIGARRDGRIVGAAVFRPAFPGAYPFRAQDPAVARALLESMQPKADPTKAYVQLVLENAPDLAEAFERAGATRHLDFVHFRGPVTPAP